MARSLQPCAAFGVALALALAPTSGRPADRLPAPLGVYAPTNAKQRAFEAACADLQQQAFDGADWDAFLDGASHTFDDFPEQQTRHALRAEVAELVGTWKIEQRTEAQLGQSVEILESYAANLRDAYGAAQPSAASEDTQVYIEDLRRRLDETRKTIPGPTQSTAVAHAPTPERDGQDRPRDRGRREPPLVVSGGVLTGVGGVLFIAGLGVYGAARSDYEALRTRNDNDTTTIDGADEERAYQKTVGPPLGLILPGVVLLGVGVGLLVAGLRARRKHRDGRARSEVVATGLRLRF